MNPNRTLLLFEDNLDNIDLALKAFQPFPNIQQIQTAKDSKESLRLMASLKDNRSFPSLILLDLNLPEIDGFEIIRALKTNPRFTKIPEIILTTSTEESDIRRAYQPGTISYLIKPVDLSDFQEIASLINYWKCFNVTLN